MISLPLTASLVIPLLLLESFFAGSEIALLSADRIRLKSESKKGSKGAKTALELLSAPEKILATTLLVTSVSMITISGLITLALVSNHFSHPELLAILFSSPLIVIFGELIPKTLYQRNADRLAPWIAGPIRISFYVLYPITWILSGYTHRLARILGPIEELMTGKRRTTREDLRDILSFGKRETDIKTSEKRMIKRILDFRDSEAKHALIPLVRVEAIEEDATLGEALDRFRQHRHSRMPVYSGRIDNIIGVLEISDLVSATELDASIRPYMSQATYVAEAQSLDELLRDMNVEDTELIVVVDEYGGAVGILTLEDIVEEIVGEIQDEYDTEIRPFRQISENQWLTQARAEIHQINESLGFGLPEGDYETLGGFLLQQFGRIPETGAELFFTTRSGNIRFVIRRATPRAIDLVLIEQTPATEDSSNS